MTAKNKNKKSTVAKGMSGGNPLATSEEETTRRLVRQLLSSYDNQEQSEAWCEHYDWHVGKTSQYALV